MKVFGIILIVVGIVMMVLKGFSYADKQKVVDVGPLEINKTETKSVGIPVYVGAMVTLAGAVILLVGKRKAV